jgi:predicted methyltransferase
VTFSALAVPALAQFGKPELSPLGKKIQAALDSELRTDAERARDANRKPIETLEFFGLREDMRVLELVPGGGWYTKVLAQILRKEGKLSVALGAQGVERLRTEKPFSKIEILDTPFPSERVGRRFEPARLDLGSEEFDLVLTFRNLHNFTEKGRSSINQAAFDALVPGGGYGVVDHTRRHMQEDGPENGRRMDPVRMIHEIEAVGFLFEGFSDLHYRADDELRYEVGRRSVSGNTDRFTLLFRKLE